MDGANESQERIADVGRYPVVERGLGGVTSRQERKPNQTMIATRKELKLSLSSERGEDLVSIRRNWGKRLRARTRRRRGGEEDQDKRELGKQRKEEKSQHSSEENAKKEQSEEEGGGEVRELQS